MCAFFVFILPILSCVGPLTQYARVTFSHHFNVPLSSPTHIFVTVSTRCIDRNMRFLATYQQTFLFVWLVDFSIVNKKNCSPFF